MHGTIKEFMSSILMEFFFFDCYFLVIEALQLPSQKPKGKTQTNKKKKQEYFSGLTT